MGSKGSAKTQTTTSNFTPPAYLNSAYQDVVSQAQNLQNQPLTQYTGPTLAGFTPLQNNAFTNIDNAANVWQPYMGNASDLVNRGTQSTWDQVPQYNSANIQQYMDPYNDSVVDSYLKDQNRANSDQQNAMTGDAILSGAYGGSAAYDAKNNLARQQSDTTSQGLSALRSAGFQNAQTQFNGQQANQLSSLQQQRQNQLAGGQAIAGFGSTALNNQLSQAQAALGAGTTQQAQVQQQLDIPYQQFQEQQAYPYNNLQYYANILNSLIGGAGGTTTGVAPGQSQNNTLSNILGIGATAASIFARDGGVIGHANGGVVSGPSYIPTSGFVQGHANAPQLPQAPQQSQDDGMGDLLKTLGVLSGSGAGHKVGTDISDLFHPEKYQDGALANMAGMSSGAGLTGYATPYFADGGVIDMEDDGDGNYSMGGRVGYDTGGAVDPNAVPVNNGIARAPILNGQPVAGFSPPPAAQGNSVPAQPVAGFQSTVAGTPVYGFDPNASKSMGQAVQTANAQKSREDIYNQLLPQYTTTTGYQGAPIVSVQDYAKAMDTLNPMQKAAYDDLTKNGSSGNEGFGVVRNALNKVLQSGSSTSIDYDALNKRADELYSQQQAAYAPKSYASGGIANGPYSKAIMDSIDPQSSLIAGLQKSGYPIAAASQGGSYIPPASSSADSQMPQDQAASAPTAGFAPAAQASAPSSPDLPVIADDTDTSSDSDNGGYENKLDEVANTPWRAALLAAGASMLDRKNLADGLAHGITGGLGTYLTVKNSKAKAEDEAKKLQLEAEKYRDERDDKQADNTREDKKVGIDQQKLDLERQKQEEGGDDANVTPTALTDLEMSALSNIPNATLIDKNGKLTGIDPNFLSAISDKRQSAQTAAAQVLKKTKNPGKAQAAYIKALGIDPSTDQFQLPTSSYLFGMIGQDQPGKIVKNADKIISDAKDAIAKGADRTKVMERIKQYGVDTKGL